MSERTVVIVEPIERGTVSLEVTVILRVYAVQVLTRQRMLLMELCRGTGSV